jgi:predicted HAD superfamily phosphohydrolase
MFSTQSSSKPRLKNDTLGNDSLTRLYAMFESSISLGEFKQICEDVVQAGGGKQARKDEIISSIKRTDSRSVALKKAQDFIMAGMGLGV